MKSLSCEQVQSLLNDLLVEDIADENADGVDAHLAWCESCRVQAVALFRNHRVMAELGVEGRVAFLADRIQHALPKISNLDEQDAVHSQSVSLRDELDSVGSERRKSGIRWRQWAMAAAACLLIGLAALFYYNRPTDDRAVPAPIAVLESVKGTAYVIGGQSDSKALAKTGQSVFAGDGLMTVGEESWIVLKYSDSTRIQIGPDSVISHLTGRTAQGEPQLSDEKKVFLANGLLSADIHGLGDRLRLIVATAKADVSVVNTAFTIVSSMDSTQVEVERGSLKLTRNRDGRSSDVSAGFYVSVIDEPEPMVLQPLAQRVRKARMIVKVGPDPVYSLAYSSDGRTVATGSEDGTIRLWDAATGKLQRVLAGHRKSVRALAFAPDGKVLASGSQEKTVILWHLPPSQEKRTSLSQHGEVWALDFSPDGKLLAVGCRNAKGVNSEKCLSLFDAATGRLIKEPKGHWSGVNTVAFSPDGQTLASAGRDATIRLWDVGTWNERQALRGHTSYITSIAFSGGGKLLASGSYDRTVKIWNVATGRTLHALPAKIRGVNKVALSPDGSMIAAAVHRQVTLWDAISGVELMTFNDGRTGSVTAVLFSPDGQSLVSCGRDRRIRFWDIPKAKSLRIPPS